MPMPSTDPPACSGEEDASLQGESRWLPAFSILLLVAIPFLLPTDVFPRAAWAFAPVAVALLIAIVVADPGRIDRRSDLLRGLSIGLTSLLVAVAVLATAWLVHELVRGAP